MFSYRFVVLFLGKLLVHLAGYSVTKSDRTSALEGSPFQ